MKKLLLCIMAAVMMTAACKKDDVLVRHEQDMVLITDGKMVTDNGLVFNVVKNDMTPEWTGWKRAFITCDVLRKVSDKEYDIHLTDIHQALLKDIVAVGDLSDEEMGDDPIDIASCWVSGDYINLISHLVYDPASGKAHFINFVYLGEEDGVLRFRLRHNSYGEYFGAPGMEPPFTLGSSYASFPIGKYIPEGKDQVQIEIIWKWHVMSAGVLTPDTEIKSARIRLRR